MSDTDRLAKFQSHKIVRAGVIKTIIPPGQIDSEKWVMQVLTDDNKTHIEVKEPRSFFARAIASPGCYYVVYDDGYTSWSPAKAFEDGYKRLS